MELHSIHLPLCVDRLFFTRVCAQTIDLKPNQIKSTIGGDEVIILLSLCCMHPFPETFWQLVHGMLIAKLYWQCMSRYARAVLVILGVICFTLTPGYVWQTIINWPQSQSKLNLYSLPSKDSQYQLYRHQSESTLRVAFRGKATMAHWATPPT